MREVFDDPASTPLAQAGLLTAIVRLIPAAEERERQAREASQRRLDAMNREELERHLADLARQLIVVTSGASSDQQSGASE